MSTVTEVEARGTLTFTQALLEALTAARQALPPESHARLAEATALVRTGAVFQADDGQTWLVASTTRPDHEYRINGHGCQCEDAHFRSGAYCKHQLAVYLCRKVLQLMQQPPAPVVPDLVEPWPDNDIEAPTRTPAPEKAAAADSPAPLGEAPCSVNCHVMIGGRQVQLTLRGHDEGEVLTRLEAVLTRYPMPQPAPQAASQPQGQLSAAQHNALAQHQAVTGWCKVHGLQMKENEKAGRRWFSHRLPEGGFCKGR